jgi:hypothetical protein
LCGSGSYDEATGEHCRIDVTLATGIDAGTTRALGLSSLDPASIDIAEWECDPETLVVHNAAEILVQAAVGQAGGLDVRRRSLG